MQIREIQSQRWARRKNLVGKVAVLHTGFATMVRIFHLNSMMMIMMKLFVLFDIWNINCSETGRSQVVSNCKGKAEFGGKSYSTRWEREYVETDIWNEGRRRDVESLTMLFFDNSWSHCRTPLYFY